MLEHRRNARWALSAAAAFFLLYVGNVLLGKLAATHAGTVYEALLLFFAVIAFVIAGIQRESREAAIDDRHGAQDTDLAGGKNDGQG